METCEIDDNDSQCLISATTAMVVRAVAVLNAFDVNPTRRMAAFDMKLDKISKVVLNDFINRSSDNV